MRKGDDMMKDDDLDALFTEMRQEKPQADAAFLARVLADAADIAADRAGPERRLRARPGPGLFSLVADMLGGWRGGLALTASALLGIYVGLTDPAGLDTVSGLVSSLSGEAVSDEAGATLFDLLLEG